MLDILRSSLKTLYGCIFFKLYVLTTHFNIMAYSKWSCFAENHAQSQHVYKCLFLFNALLYCNYQ